MKKHLLLSAACAAMMALMPTQSASAWMVWDQTWDGTSLKAATQNKAKSWMADLPDNMFIAHVSVPGSHDTMTGALGGLDNTIVSSGAHWVSPSGPGCSTTQDKNLTDQLNYGIRGVDIRPYYYYTRDSDTGDRIDEMLYCGHGVDYTNIPVTSALKQMCDFLDAHPTEFLVIHIFRANVYSSFTASGLWDSTSQTSYNRLMRSAFASGNVNNHVVAFRPNLTVGDVRGKIVLLMRDRLDFVSLPKAGILTDWTEEYNPNMASRVYLPSDARYSTKIHVQDHSSGDDDVLYNKKVPQCRQLLSDFQTTPVPNDTWDEQFHYLPQFAYNFTSIENSGTSTRVDDNTNGYKGGASVMNPSVIDYLTANNYANLGRGPIGFILSDYVCTEATKAHKYETVSDDKTYNVKGDEIVYRIIQNNFYGSNPPAKKYALDTSKDWSLKFTNPWAGQKVYIRHIPTGQYLCGAGAYGSRLSLDPYGYPWNIVMNQADGSMKINIYSKAEYIGWGGNGVGSTMWVDSKKASDQDANVISFFIRQGQQQNSYALTLDLNNTQYAATPVELGNNQNWDNTCVDYEVSHLPYTYGDPMQEYQIVTHAERLKELQHSGEANNLYGASRERPVDATFLIPAYSFGNGYYSTSDDVWNVATNSNATGGIFYCEQQQFNGAGGAFFSVYAKNTMASDYWNKWKLERTITGIPNGIYCVEFQMFTRRLSTINYKIGASSSNNTSGSVSNNIDNNGDHINSSAYTTENGVFFKKGYKTSSANSDYIVVNNVKVTNGQLYIHFDNGDAERHKNIFLLDNIHVTYLGPDAQPKTDVKVKFPQHWNTVILPFAVSSSELTKAIGTHNIKFYKAKEIRTHESEPLAENGGKPYPYHVIYTQEKAETSLEALTPYIVVNDDLEELAPETGGDIIKTKAPSRVAMASTTRDDATEYTFSGYPINEYSKATYTDGILTGVLSDNYTVNSNHWTLQDNPSHYERFTRDTDTERNVVPKFSAYVHYDENNANSTLEHPHILFKQVSNILTGVENVATDAIANDAIVDVFTPGGILVRSKVEKANALTDLPAGIYILSSESGSEKVVK